jgi:hypothetical protein
MLRYFRSATILPGTPDRMFKVVGDRRFGEITGTGHLQKGHAAACRWPTVKRVGKKTNRAAIAPPVACGPRSGPGSRSNHAGPAPAPDSIDSSAAV